MNIFSQDVAEVNERRACSTGFLEGPDVEARELIYEPDDGGSPSEDYEMDAPTELTRIQTLAQTRLARLESLSTGVTANLSLVHNVRTGQPVTSRWVADVSYVGKSGESFGASGMAEDVDDAVAQCAADFARKWSSVLVKRVESAPLHDRGLDRLLDAIAAA